MTDLVIRQGATFRRVVRVMSLPFVYKGITAIARTAPMSITAPAHGAPEGWPVAVVSVIGMDQANTELLNGKPRISAMEKATVTDVNTLALNGVNASEFDAYISGGYVQYYTPTNLTGASARMTIRDKIGGTSLIALTSPTGGITLDTTAYTITLLMTAAQTAAFAWIKGVYDLELQTSGGDVIPVMSGAISVVKEVTT